MNIYWMMALADIPAYLRAAWLTIEISVLSFTLATLLGIVGAAGRRSRWVAIRMIVRTYVEVVRNTPVLLQIYVVFFALPSLGMHLDQFTAGVLALGINVGAYLVEVFRAGLEAIPRGQWEAARMLAIGRASTFVHIALPQAMRYVFPSYINQFVQIILGSSLLGAIALPELTGTAMVINSKTLLSIQIFTIVLVIYVVLTNMVSLLASLVARHAFKPPIQLPVRQGSFGWRAVYDWLLRFRRPRVGAL
jgi:polar amino acid transport system permease protein